MTLVIAAVAFGGTQMPAGAADAIPDEGLPAVPIEASPLVSERTEILQAGVVGINRANDSFPETDVSVLAFAEHDGIIYVGGKFTAVQRVGLGNVSQPYLAAFDRETGAWIDSFRPVLNGNVWDLKVTDDGDLLVAGQFSHVNGAANTAALARIDLATGAVDPTWRVRVVLTGSTARPLVRTLDIEGDDLYLGGNFTRVAGPDGDLKSAGRLVRVSLTTGNVDGAFLPNINGVVFDVDADGDRVYAVGNFHYTNGVWTIGLSVTYAANGQVVSGLRPWVRTYTANVYNSYQQAVMVTDNEVWQVGAQHSHQVYRRSDHLLLRGFVSDPWGDGQALTRNNGIVYGGNHANGDTYMYSDATTRPVTSYSSRLPVRWMGAWDDATNTFLDWYPQVGSANGEGAWELFVDSTDCLWAGGDFHRGSYDGATARFVKGFAKFCAIDRTPPAPPTNLVVSQRGDIGVNLAWDASPGDDRDGVVFYELLRNDEVIASHISITSFADRGGQAGDRYFVRAMDYAGNRSATTSVAQVSDVKAPTTPENLAAVIEDDGDVTLTWDGSYDNVGVTEYQILRNGVEIGTVAAESTPISIVDDIESAAGWINDPNGTDTGDGDGVWEVSFPEETTRRDVLVQPGSVTAGSFALNTVGLEGNHDVDSGVESVRSPSFELGPGMRTLSFDYYVGIATGTAGDWFRVTLEGEQSSTVLIDRNFDGQDVPAEWTPVRFDVSKYGGQTVTLLLEVSDDDVVAAIVEAGMDNLAFDGVEATPGLFVVPAPDSGSHWYQVRALDAAGNESWRTPSVRVDIAGPDTQRPSTPQNLAAVVEASGDVTLSWDASTDDVGVVDYRVFRNGVELAVVDSPGFVVAAPAVGSHWYQVLARDAAGNESWKTPSVRVDIAAADTTKPSTPQNLAAVVEASGDVTLSWDASTDDVGVTEYQVLRNGVEIGVTATPGFVVAAPAVGSHWYQVRARDAAGNESWKTPSVRVDIAAADTQKPSTPQNLVGLLRGGDVALQWDAATDDVGVVEYQVLRNGVEVGVTSDLHFVHVAPGVGSHWYQVRARDAAGNEGNKTAPIRIDIP